MTGRVAGTVEGAATWRSVEVDGAPVSLVEAGAGDPLLCLPWVAIQLSTEPPGRFATLMRSALVVHAMLERKNCGQTVVLPTGAPLADLSPADLSPADLSPAERRSAARPR